MAIIKNQNTIYNHPGHNNNKHVISATKFQSYNDISFKGISWDIDNKETPEEKPASPGRKLIDKVLRMIRQTHTVSPQEFNQEMEQITQKSREKSSEINNRFFVFRRDHRLKLIDEEETREKEKVLRKQEYLAEESMERSQDNLKAVEELPKELAKFDPAVDLARREKMTPIKEKEKEIKNRKGFERIAGYQLEKDILKRHFIEAINSEKLGKNVNIPGSVLFFGPTANGKTTFAKAFAEATGCILTPIRVSTNRKLSKQELEKGFIQKLYKEAEIAKQKFNTDKIRTIIFIDEVTEIANKTSCILSEFEKFLAICSKQYYCTIFAATNHPLNLGLDMSKKATTFPVRISIDPPDRKNAIDVFKHYLAGRSSKDINYSKLVDELKSNSRDGAYSNGQIEKICNNCYEEKQETMTQEDLINYIRQVKPAIDSTALQKFKKESELFMLDKIESL